MTGFVHVASPTGPWSERVGPVPLLLSAPHAAAQVRDGAPKRAEQDTRRMARELAELLDASTIATEPQQLGDPNWDPDSPYLARLLAWEPVPVAVLDLHVMRPRGVDLCLGLGEHPPSCRSTWTPLATAAVEAGLTVALNWPFAAGPRTLTSQLQRAGRTAVQLEISYECLAPAAWDRTRDALLLGLSALVPAGH